jgi:pSer/pThr/pTyr-binding forkhead associated (FHA) protein
MPRFTLLSDDEGIPARSFEANGQELLVGRHPDAPICLADSTVSRRHALIRRQGESWIVEDLGSVNGFTILARRMARHALEPGDRIRITHYTLIFEPPEDIWLEGLGGGEPDDGAARDVGMTFISADAFGLCPPADQVATGEQRRASETEPRDG